MITAIRDVQLSAQEDWPPQPPWPSFIPKLELCTQLGPDIAGCRHKGAGRLVWRLQERLTGLATIHLNYHLQQQLQHPQKSQRQMSHHHCCCLPAHLDSEKESICCSALAGS